jgi:hypothetical protein
MPNFKNEPITITIDNEWVRCLLSKIDTVSDADAGVILNMLKDNDDVLYQYIDDAILEMVNNSGV